MNPHACRVVLRPRGPLEVFDLAVRLIRAHPSTWLRLVVATALPPILVGGVICALTDEADLLLLMLFPVVAPLLQAPATVLAGRLLFANEVRVRDVLQEVGRRSGTLFGGLLAWLVAWTLGCGLFSWLTALPLTWTAEATLLEQVPLARVLRRSSSLALANIGVAVTAQVTWMALTLWGVVVGEALGHGIVGTVLQLGEPFGNATDLVLTPWVVAGALGVQPLYGAYRLLLYVDARTRNEGWDLQVALRAAALAATEAP
ncbi:MAG: hypothetical protein KC621_35190 [Myxococcales bacterium]|nr:hypothetical protein [Myxococcales bacterium]